MAPEAHRPCPDDGTCHHSCPSGYCFRVRFCGPLSGVFLRDEWPADVVEAHGAASIEDPTVEEMIEALLK